MVASTQDRFVSTETVRSLLSGSFESRIGDAHMALERHQADIFEDGVQFHLVATFEHRALVATDDGRFAEVIFEGSPWTLVEVRPIEVPTVSEAEVGTSTFESAKRAVDAFFGGRLDEAMLLLEAVARRTPALTEEQVVDRVIRGLSTPRPWRAVYATKQGLFESAEPAGNSSFEPVLSEILEASDAVDEADTIALVGQEFRKLAEGLDDLLAGVNASLESMSSEGTFTDAEDVADPLRAFAMDLEDDLAGLVRLVENASGRLSSPVQMARLYDALAREFPAYEHVGSFLRKAAERLRSQ